MYNSSLFTTARLSPILILITSNLTPRSTLAQKNLTQLATQLIDTVYSMHFFLTKLLCMIHETETLSPAMWLFPTCVCKPRGYKQGTLFH